MVQFHPFRDVTKENIRGVQTLVQRRLWNFFVANYRGVLPYKGLIGMCRWMGSHFHGWSDYNGVAFSVFSPGRGLVGFPQEKLKWRIKTKKMRALGRRGKL